jgi:PAS domain S-box-containing protein
MGIKRKRKIYNLEYIEKLFRFVPLYFICLLAIVSTIISYFVLEFKQNKEIFLLQENTKIHFEFQKKEILYTFVKQIQTHMDRRFGRVINGLKKHTYKIMGHLEDLPANELQNYLRMYEKKHNISISLIDKEALNIFYDAGNMAFLEKLIFGIRAKEHEQKVVDLIVKRGKEDLQYWDDLNGNLKISFFEEIRIENKIYYMGLFSQPILTYNLAQETIFDFIKKLSSNLKYDIWMMDLKSKKTFNYFNNHALVDFEEIKPKENLKYRILNHFVVNGRKHPSFDKVTYLDKQYEYMLAIDYDVDTVLDTTELEKYYQRLFINVCLYIVLISLIFLVFSILFSRFTKNVLNKYNQKLRARTNSLLHWKKRFEFAVIASNDGLWDIDFKTHKIYFSAKWLEMTGYKRNQILRFSDWFDLVHPEDKNSVEKIFEKIFLMKSDTFIGEYRLRTQDGSYKWMLTRGRLFKEDRAYKNRMLMMSMDIDKNKMMKKELSDIELLVDDGEIVIFKLFNDEQLSVKYISNSIRNYGYFKYEFESKNMTFLQLIHKEDLFRVHQLIEKSVRNELSHFSFVCRIVNALDEVRWISCRMVLIKDYSGEVVNFYGYMNDITQIKVSEEELKQKVEEAVNNNRHKDRMLVQQSKLASMGEMIGSIAHQWRQPLNNVSLFLQFLQDNYGNDKIDDEMIENYFLRARTQINYMSQTIDDFRNFYQPTKDKNLFVLKESIETAAKIVTTQYEKEDILLTIAGDEIELFSYENELQQVIVNILNNAKDAAIEKRKTESFTPKVNVSIRKVNNNAIIDISNNCGTVSNQVLSRMFEPYFTTKFENQGTGIGLYMSKTIIEKNMNGRIGAKIIENGLNFSIILPI